MIELFGFKGLPSIKLLPTEGGGWRAVVDSGIKGGVAAGLLCGLGVGIALLGVLAYNRGRKMSSPSASEAQSGDTRPPVLYLRSFLEDSVTAATPQPVVIGIPVQTVITNEEQIAAVLRNAGPVVAVGRPGERLPELGAARLYLEDKEWKGQVSALMHRSRLIVIRVGTSEGLFWEIQTAIEQNRPEALVLLIPFEAPRYKQFSENVRQLFPRPLPDWPSTSLPRSVPRKPIELDVRAIVYFDSYWQGTLEVLQPTKTSVRTTRPLGEPFAKSMQSVYDRFGIDQYRPSALHRMAKATATVIGLAPGLMPGVLLGLKIGPALKPLTDKLYQVRIFSKTRADQLADALPGPYGRAFRDEINKSQVVSTWVESARMTELEQMGARIASGMPRLSDDLLNERASIMGVILNSVDVRTCAAVIRSIPSAGQAAGAQEEIDLMPLIETHLGRGGVEGWAHISVIALEADLTNVPARRVNKDQLTRAVIEMLNLLSDSDRTRMMAGLQRYQSLLDPELCWVERTLNHVRPQLTPAARSALLRAPFGTEP